MLRSVRVRLWAVGCRPLQREASVQSGDGPGQPEHHAEARYCTGGFASPILCPHLKERADHLSLALTTHRVTGTICSVRRHNCAAVRGYR